MTSTRIALTIGLTALTCVTSAMADTPIDEIRTYDRADWKRDVTDCDRLAAHPGDPERVEVGVEQSDVDTEAAIAACETALDADPDNPRLNYQMARAHGYAGRHDEADPYRDRAVRAGYPQSLFVIGYIRMEGWDGRAPDPCYGGQLVRLSALAGRYAGLVGFPHYYVRGAFADCSDVPVDPAEMRGFLKTAETQADDFYQRLAVEHLSWRLEATLAD